ncbi:MAG: alpha/beta hydrolase [Bifidobacteriaceae bacterium]|nr:alpha/beta hydrolase [Bifidobacteriaceae bacterium]
MNQTIDPEVAAWVRRGLEVTRQLGIDPAAPTAVQRAATSELADTLFGEYGEPGDPSVVKTCHHAPGQAGPIRIFAYRPAARATVPALILLHGGGWAIGGIDEAVDDSLARCRAARAGYAVFDVDYRLAPEHPFPAALEDAYSALRWVVANAAELRIDPGRVAVNGSSAGGNLSAALALLARDRGGPGLIGQVLEVPAVDLTDAGLWEVECPDMSNGMGTTRGIRAAYLGGILDAADNPYVSPLLSPDLSGLPPTHIMVAEVDPLRDQGLAYAARLRQAGVSVTASLHLGELHGSASVIGRFRGARLWQEEVCAALRDFLRPAAAGGAAAGGAAAGVGEGR